MKYRKKRPGAQGTSPRKPARRKSSYSKTKPLHLPAVWSNKSRRDQKLTRQIAASLDRQGRSDLALKVWCCGAKDESLGVYPCGKPFCCEFCGAVAGYGERRDRAARMLIALAANPHLVLFFITLTTHDEHDFATQVKNLKTRMKKLLKRGKGAWGKLRGVLWWIHPARGADGSWRCHIHAIVAFDERDAPRNPRCLILRWAHDHRTELPEPWLRATWESDRKYRDIIEHQEIEPLYCYRSSGSKSEIGSRCNPVSRLFDVMSVAEYSRTDHRDRATRPGKRHVPLSADDRVLITLLGLRLRGCQGVFDGVNSDDRKSLEKQINEFDRSPSLRRQLHLDALRSPSITASLIPRPESDIAVSGRRIVELPSDKQEYLRALQRKLRARRK